MSFEEYLDGLLREMKVSAVTVEDADRLEKALKREIKKLEEARRGFAREWVTVKERGRVVIPKRLRNALGLVEGTVLDCHLYPDPMRPRGLVMIKEG